MSSTDPSRVAAIYARYSSQNQRPESNEDQIRECREQAERIGFLSDSRFVFMDEAKSGADLNRTGLAELLAAAKDGHFQTVLIDDLSRLPRDNYFMLGTLRDLEALGVRVLGVADGIDTADEDGWLKIQMLGVINQQYLQDLRKKTTRGQIGQKKRGYTVGEKTFGFQSVPDGETRLDKHGRPRPQGYKMKIRPDEARVVLLIFELYDAGKSVSAIVKHMNEKGIKGATTWKKWSTGTVTRILNNEKYIGRWVWRKSKLVRTTTGKKKQLPRPEHEWIVREEPELRIVPQDLWDRVQARRAKVREAYEKDKSGRGFSRKQRGAARDFPTSLFAGSLVCGDCGGSVHLVGGKGGGYFGCGRATRKACGNRLTVPRARVERMLLQPIKEFLVKPERVREILEVTIAEIRRQYTATPEKIEMTERELDAERRKLENFLKFVAEGKAPSSLRHAMVDAERKIAELEHECVSLRTSAERVLKPPPLAWIKEKLEAFRELLERDVRNAALALRHITGSIKLVPVHPDIGKPYYRAETLLGVFPLLDPPRRPDGGGSSGCTSGGNENDRGPSSGNVHGLFGSGSDSFRWWRIPGSNR